MSQQEESQPQVSVAAARVTRAVAGAVAYLAFITFGILLITDGDWVPGSLILGAGIVGWVVLVPLIGRLCRGE